jgi:1-acyl-sn-glycerol-3-phosphate acyltransferase
MVPHGKNLPSGMKAFPRFIYHFFRCFLSGFLPAFLDLRYRIQEPFPPGPKIFAGNHPTAWDVFPPIMVCKKAVLHALIEEQIWSLPGLGLIMKITNQVRMYRGVQSAASMRDAVAWLRRGESLLMAPEGERTDVRESRSATQGVIRLALAGGASIIPGGVWVPVEDTLMKPVKYHYKGKKYSIDSYFPRFRGKYAMVYGKAVHLDEYFGKKIGHQKRQELADMVLEKIYEYRGEARRLCEDEKTQESP